MTTVPFGNIAIFTLLGEDEGDNVRAATGTVSVSDQNAAYVNKNAGGEFVLVPKTLAPGSNINIVVNVDACNALGVDLPLLSIAFLLIGPPAIQATHIVIASGPVVRDTIGYGVPDDPGGPIQL